MYTGVNICDDILQAHGYIVGDAIGKGATSEIYIVTKPQYKEKFVCKIMETFFITDKKKYHGFYKSEVASLLKLPHKNIIRLYDYFAESDYFFIIMEYCSHGDLDTLIKRSQFEIKDHAIQYAQQIVDSVDACHAKGIAHCDIKPQNILVNSNHRIKLSDFGHSLILDCNANYQTCRGSAAYKSPEMANGTCTNPFKADVWSVGVTLYRMISGKSKKANVTANHFQKQVIEECEELGPLGKIILSCIIEDPNVRPTINCIKRMVDQLAVEENDQIVKTVHLSYSQTILRTRRNLTIPKVKSKLILNK